MNGREVSAEDARSVALSRPLHIETPLLRSRKLSEHLGSSVWLKMETMQNSGSFKVRGIGHLCQKSVREGCTQFVSSSGGNAGLAAAYCAKELCIPIRVVVPEPTPEFVVKKLVEEGATVEVVGKAWDDANKRALELAAAPGAVLIHPFDHPDIWSGHASMVEELQHQLHGLVPDLIVVSVGGGGLMNGVLEGLYRVGWSDVPLLAMETEGADSLNACAKAGEWTQLPEITSIARCLGAKRVSQKSYEWLSKHHVTSHVVSDRDAVSACVRLADDHRVLIPPSCGAALTAVYCDVIAKLQKSGQLPGNLENVVIIVCGGSEVTLETIKKWKEEFKL